MRKNMLVEISLYRYGQTVNSYGEKVVSNTPTSQFLGHIVEKSTDIDKESAKGESNTHLCTTRYSGVNVGDILKVGNTKFRVTNVVTSTRMTQLGLVKYD